MPQVKLLDLNLGGQIYIMALDLPIRPAENNWYRPETSEQEAGGRAKLEITSNACFGCRLPPASCLLN